MEYLLAVLTVSNFRMELNGIQLLFGTFKSSTWTIIGLSLYCKALWKFAYIVGMTHPYNILFGNILEQQAACLTDLNFSVFAFGTA